MKNDTNIKAVAGAVGSGIGAYALPTAAATILAIAALVYVLRPLLRDAVPALPRYFTEWVDAFDYKAKAKERRRRRQAGPTAGVRKSQVARRS
jgi:hypothetical protein